MINSIKMKTLHVSHEVREMNNQKKCGEYFLYCDAELILLFS